MTSREIELQEMIEDLAYVIFWSVSLGPQSQFLSAEPGRAIDMNAVANNEYSVFVDYIPGDEYLANAVAEFQKLDWTKFGLGEQEIGAISYILHSDSTRAICTNDQDR